MRQLVHGCFIPWRSRLHRCRVMLQTSKHRMKTANEFRIVLVTAPDIKTARHLARTALEARLIACANLLPKVESHYWWQGKIESAGETMLVLKTKFTHLAKLERLILQHHPYDTPEMIVLPLASGTPRYLKWLADTLQ